MFSLSSIKEKSLIYSCQVNHKQMKETKTFKKVISLPVQESSVINSSTYLKEKNIKIECHVTYKMQEQS